MQQVLKSVFVHSCVWESCLCICVQTGMPPVMSCVFVCLPVCRVALVSVFMCTLRAGEEGGGALTSDIYCLICQTLLALWVSNLLIKSQDSCLFQRPVSRYLSVLQGKSLTGWYDMFITAESGIFYMSEQRCSATETRRLNVILILVIGGVVCE